MEFAETYYAAEGEEYPCTAIFYDHDAGEWEKCLHSTHQYAVMDGYSGEGAQFSDSESAYAECDNVRLGLMIARALKNEDVVDVMGNIQQAMYDSSVAAAKRYDLVSAIVSGLPSTRVRPVLDAVLAEIKREAALSWINWAERSTDDIYVHDNDDMVPSWMGVYGIKAYWVSTDAWRGYTAWRYNTEKLKRFSEGWVTGWLDDTVSYKQEAIDLNDFLSEEKWETPPPCDIIWLFGVTSNVFSTSSMMLVADLEAFTAWLKSEGFDVEAVADAFN